MDRDMELVKKILKEIRDGNYELKQLNGLEDEKVRYHLKIMGESNLVDVDLTEVATQRFRN